jgi:hypothetical protein
MPDGGSYVLMPVFVEVPVSKVLVNAEERAGPAQATGRSRQDACEPPLPRVPFGTWPAHVVTLGPVGIEQGAAEIVEQLGDLGSQDLRRWPACISP